MKLNTLRTFTQASYRNIKLHFTKLVEHNKNRLNKKNRIFKTQELCLDVYYSSCFIEYLLYPIACCLPHLRSSVLFRFCFMFDHEAGDHKVIFNRKHYLLLTTVRSRNAPMTKLFTSWLLPSFLQH